MSASLALLALTTWLPSSHGERPTWLTEYSLAREVGRLAQRPLAVVIGSGPQGWDQLSRNGKLNVDVNRLLSAHYVCVYLNIQDHNCKRLASTLQIPNGLGVVRPAPGIPPPR